MNTYIDKLVLLVIRDKKLLMVREKLQSVPFLLGGKREGDETDEEALVREVSEEIGADIVPGTLVLFDVFETPAVGKPAGTLVRGTCYFGDIQGELTPQNEIEEIVYVTYEDHPQNNALACAVFEDLRKKKLL